jgi:hypothetical protein
MTDSESAQTTRSLLLLKSPFCGGGLFLSHPLLSPVLIAYARHRPHYFADIAAPLRDADGGWCALRQTPSRRAKVKFKRRAAPFLHNNGARAAKKSQAREEISPLRPPILHYR